MSGLATALGALPTAVGDGAVAPVVADFSQDVFWVWQHKAVAIIVFLLTNLVVDLLSSVLDPRIRHE